MTMNGIVVALFYVLPADRQLVVPDLITFIRDRYSDLNEYLNKRKEKQIYASPKSLVVDLNENIIV